MFGGGVTAVQTPSSPTDSPNTLRSKGIAEILAVIGEGPIVAPADVYQSVYLNGIPVKNADGTFNFQNVTIGISLGAPGQAYVPGTSAAETLHNVNTKVVYATPIVKAITDTTATSARVTITISALVYQDSNGNRGPWGVSFSVEVQPNGGSYTQVMGDNVFGKCVSPVAFDYDIPLAGSGPWNVRVKRLSPDAASSNELNDIYFSSLTTVRAYRLAYPNTAILRIRIDAEQFGGNFPTIEYQGKLLTLQIPSNFNPVTRTYTGIWDGTFTTGWTDDPAWVLWNIATNARWGLGRWISASRVDKWALYAASQWFSERVPDGKGGTECRFSFNGYIDSAQKAYDSLVYIAGACQSMAYWSSGAASFVVDKPSSPVKQISPANAFGGKFTYRGTDIATRPTAAYVTWRDPSNGYQPAVECVEFPTQRDTYGLRVKEVAAVLCTSQGQAHRAGLDELETAWSETQTATWGVGEDQQDLMPGDIVAVSDPIIQGIRLGGRLIKVTGGDLFDVGDLFSLPYGDLFGDPLNHPTLDAPVALLSGQAYKFRVTNPSGVLEERAVTTLPGLTQVIDLASPLSVSPVPGATWQLNSDVVAARYFRVIGVDENSEENTYAISAVSHDPNKQARIDGSVVLHLPGFSAYPSGPIVAPINLSIIEAIERLSSGTWLHRTTLGWGRSIDPRVARYDVQFMYSSDADWTAAGSALGTTAELDELGSGPYLFRVRAIGYDNQPSPWSTVLTQVLTGLDAPPPDVTGFNLQTIDTTASLSWAPVTAANLDHYEVRHSPDQTNVTWQSMVPIAQNVVGSFVQVPALSGVFAVKAFTAQGKESANPALIITNTSGLDTNIVATLTATHTTSYSGTFTNAALDAARRIVLAPNAPDLFSVSDLFSLPQHDLLGYLVFTNGTFAFTQTIDLGEVYTSRVSAVISATGIRTTDDIWNQINVWSLTNVWGSNPSGWDCWVEVRWTSDDPAVNPTWSAWRRLVAGDITARAFQARIRLTTSDTYVTPAVEATITFDMPDETRSGAHIPISVTGTTISFSPAFFGPDRPSIVPVAIEGAQTGDYVDITAISKSGFTATVRNSGGVAQSGRSIDYHAKGWGSVG